MTYSENIQWYSVLVKQESWSVKSNVTTNKKHETVNLTSKDKKRKTFNENKKFLFEYNEK